jgi:hypothetical protein
MHGLGKLFRNINSALELNFHRAKMFTRAEEYIRSVENPSEILWTSLLGASHNYNDIKMAERAAAEVIKKLISNQPLRFINIFFRY